MKISLMRIFGLPKALKKHELGLHLIGAEKIEPGFHYLFLTGGWGERVGAPGYWAPVDFSVLSPCAFPVAQ